MIRSCGLSDTGTLPIGRFLYRSATVMGGIVDELGPSGRTGMALRGASSKALGFMGAKKPNDPTCPS
jgi:hypothetical protein